MKLFNDLYNYYHIYLKALVCKNILTLKIWKYKYSYCSSSSFRLTDLSSFFMCLWVLSLSYPGITVEPIKFVLPCQVVSCFWVIWTVWVNRTYELDQASSLTQIIDEKQNRNWNVELSQCCLLALGIVSWDFSNPPTFLSFMFLHVDRFLMTTMWSLYT